MSYKNLYKSTKKEKQFIFQDVANQKNLKAFAIEKDWWVVQTLDVIFQLDIAEHILFKGGTEVILDNFHKKSHIEMI